MKRASAVLFVTVLFSHLAFSGQSQPAGFDVRADIARAIAKVATARRHGTPATARTQIHSLGLANAPTTSIGYLSAATVDEGGNSAYAEAGGDFNGDGSKDIATIVGNGDGVTFWISVALGHGDGTFGAPALTPVSFSTGDRLYAADLNNDNKTDLVLVHTGNLDVFIGNGDGTFATAVNYNAGVDSFSGAFIGDVNADNAADVVVLSAGSATPMVSTLLNTGNGAFAPATLVAFPAQQPNGVFADVNGDGKLDVISSTEVFLANPTGGYASGVSLVNASNSGTCGGDDGAIAIADVNGDSQPDIITADCEYNTVTVFLNAGGGSFQPGTSFWAGVFPQAISIADMNGDGIADIVSSNAYSSDVTVLTGHGDGSFQTAQVGYSVGGLDYELPLVSDFNNDNKADVVASNFVTDENFAAAYLQGLGNGSFIGARDYFSPPPPLSGEFGLGLASADFNGDGRPDFVLGNSGSNSEGVTVFLTDADGSMQPGVNYGSGGSLNFPATGDFNGDGKQDIVAADSNAGTVDLFLGNGDGTFQSAQTFAAAAGNEGIAVGDFNQDGKPDVAVMGFNLAVLLNNGNGGLLPAASYSSMNSSLVTAADVNGDGNLDLILPQIGGNALYLLLGKSDGTFQTAPDIPLGHANPAGIAVGDFNGDGKADIAVTIEDFSGMGIAISLGNGDGTFQAAVLYPCTTHNLASEQPYPNGITAVDVDHDGKLDLVYTQVQSGLVGIIYGKGDGTFYSPVEFPAGAYPYQLVAADINGDGAQDAVISGGLFSGITVLLNRGGNTVTLTSSANPSTSGQSVTFTATVAATVLGVSAVPTGTVTFSDGSTSLGSAPVSAGRATLSVSTLASGNHSITASYSGDTSFIPSVSSGLTETVAALPSFSISATPVTAKLQAGSSATFSVTITPANGYTGTVTFTCGSLPKGVTCNFAPSSALVAGSPVSVQLTVSDAATTGAAAPMNLNGMTLWTTGAFGFVLLEGFSKSRRRWMMAVVALLALAAMLSLSGCGGASSTVTSTPGLPGPGNNSSLLTIQVIATGPAANGGTITQQVALKLTISN